MRSRFVIILSCILVLSMFFIPTSFAASQITSERVKQYGFKLGNGSDYVFNYMSENDKTATSVKRFYANNSEIGATKMLAIRGRSKTVTAGTYDDVLLVKVSMSPKKKLNADGATYTGLCDLSKVSMTLNSGQKYVNSRPTAYQPDLAVSKSFSMNVGKNGDTFGFGATFGNTTTKTEAGLKTLNNCDASRGSYVLQYDYLPRTSTKGSTLKACKEINKWLTNTHDDFYVMAYTTPKANTSCMRVRYDVGFLYAVTSGDFDGTPSKIKTQLDKSGYLYVNYAGSGSNY